MRKQVIALYALIGIGILLFSVLIWGPAFSRVWIKNIVSNQINKYLGSPVAFHDIRFYLFPPAVELDQIQYEKDSGPLQYVSAERLRLTIGLSPSLSGKIRIKKVDLIQPKLKLNFSEIQFNKTKSKKESGSKFRLPTLKDLLRVQIDEIAISKTGLEIELPGKYTLKISSDAAGFYRTKGVEFWTWNGEGYLIKGTNVKKVEHVVILAKRQGQKVEIVNFQISGVKNTIQASGQAYPEANLTIQSRGESKDLFQALKDMDFTKKVIPVTGKYIIETKVSGPWDALNQEGNVNLQQINFKGRIFDETKIQFSVQKNVLKAVKGEANLNGSKVNFELSNIAQNKRAHFKITGNKINYDVVQLAIDPTVPSIIDAFVDVSAEGEIGIQPFSMVGNYRVQTSQFTFQFPPMLVPYLPIELKQISVDGKMNWTQSEGCLLEGSLTADGFQGPYKLNFPEPAKIDGAWDFAVSKFGQIFTKDYPVIGKGRIKGGLTLNNGELKALFGMDIKDLQYHSHERSNLTGDLVFTNKGTEINNVQVVTQNKKGSVKFDGKFGHGEHGETTAEGEAKNFDLAWISDMVSRRFPFVAGVQGRGSATVSFHGSTNNIEGNIAFESGGLDWREQHFNKVISKLHLQPNGLDIRDTQFIGDDLQISAKGGVLTEKYQGLVVKVKKMPLGLLGVPSLVKKYFEQTNATLYVDGDAKDPDISLNADLFRMNLLTAELDNVGTVTAKGKKSKLNWEAETFEKKLRSAGTLEIGEKIKLTSSGELNKFAMFLFVPGTDSAISGTWNFSGNIDDLKSWNGNLDVTTLNIRNNKLDYKIKDQFSLTINNGSFHLTPFVLGDRDARLAMSGDVDENENLNFGIKGKVPISLLTLLPLKLTRADGVADVNLGWSGKLRNPILNGKFVTKSAYIQNSFWPHPLEDLDVEADIDSNRIHIISMDGKMADGKVDVKGDLLLPTASSDARIFLNGTVDQAWIRFPEWLPVLVSGNFLFEGLLSKPLLKGDFVVLEGTYKNEWDWKKQILSVGSGAARTTRIYKKNEETIQFDISFRSDNGKFVLRNNLAIATMKADLRILGSNVNFGMLGQIQILDGEVTFLDRKFILSPGVINFTDANQVATSFDLNAQTRIQNSNTDIFLDIRTEGDEIRAYLSSNPVKDETTIVSLLTLGVELDDLAVTSNSDQGVSLSLIPSVLSGPVQSRVETGLRRIKLIDTFQFIPYFSEITKTTSMRLLVAKDLFTKVRLSYSTDVFNTGTGNTFALEHILNQNIKFSGSLGSLVDSTSSVETNNEYNLGFDVEFRLDF